MFFNKSSNQLILSALAIILSIKYFLNELTAVEYCSQFFISFGSSLCNVFA